MKVAKGTVAELRGARNYARLIDALLTTGGTTEELAEITGFHIATIYRYVKALRELETHERKVNKCRIISWSPDARGYLTRPVYKLERGRDVTRPRMTEAQKSKAYRQRRDAPSPLNSVFAVSA